MLAHSYLLQIFTEDHTRMMIADTYMDPYLKTFNCKVCQLYTWQTLKNLNMQEGKWNLDHWNTVLTFCICTLMREEFPGSWSFFTLQFCGWDPTPGWRLGLVSVLRRDSEHFPKPWNGPTPCCSVPNAVTLLPLPSCSGMCLRNWIILSAIKALRTLRGNEKLEGFF